MSGGRFALVLLTASLLLSDAAAQDAASPDQDRARWRALADRVVIHRDEWGVPHVFGQTDAATVFGYVYARAEDELDAMQRFLLTILGRLAEVEGESAFAQDRAMRAFETERRGREHYAAASSEVRALADAGADALNFFVATRPDVSPLIERFEGWHFFAGALAFALGQVPTLDPETLEETPARIRSERDGSNMWAIAPARSESGHALLFINPHVPLGEVYEGHLHSESGWHLSGLNVYGSGLFPVLGHTEHHAWSVTVNYPDVADVYRLTFDDPGDPLAYRYGDGHRRARSWEETIEVRTKDGMTERSVTLLASHHGPILGEHGGHRFAVRVAGLQSGGLLAQWYAMGRAESFAEFRAAIDDLALVYHNIAYADRSGNVFYVYNARIPRRDPSRDWRRAVDGSDPSTEWRGVHTLEELPQVLNPDTGWLQNCNSSPFTTTSSGNPSPADFPSYLIGRDRDDPRVQMSHALLSSRPKISFEQLERLAFDTRIFEADRWLPVIFEGWRSLSPSEPDLARHLTPAIERLRVWDRRADLESVATTHFLLWWESQLSRIFGATPPTPEEAIRALAGVMDQLDERFGTSDLPWGEINRHQRRLEGEPPNDDRPSLAIAGAHGAAGVAFTFLARTHPGTKRRYGFHGHSYVGIVELGPRVRARTIVPFGASRDPESKHWFDQASLYARGELKDAWFWPEDVKANATRSYHPGE